MKTKEKTEGLKYNAQGLEIFDIDSDLEERTAHGTKDFPIAIYSTQLSKLLLQQAQPHWHSEIQLLFILEGLGKFTINNNSYEIEEGNGVFINSGCVHSAKKIDEKDCTYISVNIDTGFFASPGSLIQREYFQPFFSSEKYSSIVLLNTIEWQRDILRRLKEIYREYNGNIKQNALKNYNAIQNIIFSLIYNTDTAPYEVLSYSKEDEIRVKNMISFIHENYMNKIKLADFAQINNVNSEECCRSFKRVINMSPFEYLISHRINKSIYLLQTTDLSITQIALDVGFNSTSYYIGTFKEKTGYTPSQFRKAKDRK